MAPSVSYQVRIDRSGSRPKLVWIDERDGRAQVRATSRVACGDA